MRERPRKYLVESAGMAQQVSPPDDAPRTKDGQGGHGQALSHSLVLDVAPRMGLRAVERFGSHAGQPENRYGVQSNTEILIGRPAPLWGV
jgi:hypothetical protein